MAVGHLSVAIDLPPSLLVVGPDSLLDVINPSMLYTVSLVCLTRLTDHTLYPSGISKGLRPYTSFLTACFGLCYMSILASVFYGPARFLSDKGK